MLVLLSNQPIIIEVLRSIDVDRKMERELDFCTVPWRVRKSKCISFEIPSSCFVNLNDEYRQPHGSGEFQASFKSNIGDRLNLSILFAGFKPAFSVGLLAQFIVC